LNKYKKYTILALLVLSLGACRHFKETAVGKFLNDLSSRDNGYFNAREKLKEVEKVYFDNTIENYDEVLNIYPTGDSTLAKNQTASLDIVIKKCTEDIRKHDGGKWLPACYYLIGKAYFYKKDYFASMEIFQYLATKYPNSEYTPQSPLWEARSRSEMGRPAEALAVITTIKNNKNFPVTLNTDFDLVQADYYIRGGEYRLAINMVNKAMPEVKGRKYRTRYYFILGQMYQRILKNDSASYYYKKVIKRNPPYDLSFQAKIALAETDANKEESKRYLIRLTKDQKNADYFDQIYFALAKLELQEGNKPKAMEYLVLSARKSKKNTNQKALSYITLADLYFADQNYPPAKKYYDSAGKYINKRYPNYEQFNRRQKVLGELITNLITKKDQDSIQRISLFTKPRLKQYIDSVYKKQQQDLENNVSEKNSDVFYGQQNLQSTTDAADNSGGSPFDNPAVVERWKSDFQKKWGNRPLVDNWQRQEAIKAEAQALQNSPDKQKNKNDTAKAPKDSMQQGTKRYYAAILTTPTQWNYSNNKLQDALYNIGYIYYQNLDEYRKSADALEELLTRFPDNQYLEKTNYYLYKDYLAMKDTVKANQYKDYLHKKYPDGTYDNLIQHPERLSSNKHTNPALEELYHKTYEAFKANKCSEVSSYYNEANQKFNDNYLRSKFEYLHIICLIKNDSTGKSADSLNSFAKRYPNDPLAAQAKDLYKYLTTKPKHEKVSKIDSIKNAEAGNYLQGDQGPHFVIFFFAKGLYDLNLVKSTFSDYNYEAYTGFNYSPHSASMGTKYDLVYIDGFADRKTAMDYLKRLKQKPDLFEKAKLNHDHKDYIIDEFNYKALLKNKNLDSYDTFYKENYID